MSDEHNHLHDLSAHPIAERISAMLDGELSEAESAALIAEIEADPRLKQAFQAQQGFDADLKRVLVTQAEAFNTEAGKASNWRDSLKDGLDREDARARDVRNTSVIMRQRSGSSGRTTKRSLRAQANVPISGRVYSILQVAKKPQVAAAMILLALGVSFGAGWAFAPKVQVVESTQATTVTPSTPLVQISTPIPEETRGVLTTLVQRGNDIVLRSGTHDQARIKEYSESLGVMLPPDHYYPRWSGVIQMHPVNVVRVEGEEVNYDAICFCTGNVVGRLEEIGYESDRTSIDAVVTRRAVLFMLDGDLLAPIRSLRTEELSVISDVSYTVVCRFDPKMGKTCIFYSPSTTSEVEARELAMPLLDHGNRSTGSEKEEG